MLKVVARAVRRPEAREGVAADVYGVLARQRVVVHALEGGAGRRGGGDGGENGARRVGVALLVVDDDVSHGLLLHVPGKSHATAERERESQI